MEELLSSKEVCKLLKVSKTWPYKMAKGGRLPYYKLEGVVRFRKSDIEAFLEQSKVKKKEKMEGKRKGRTDLGANKAIGICRGCLKRTDGKIDWLIDGFCETCRPR